ncbi:MAG: hypothetical protein GFH27_549283n107 [Chloroflexi bacterium AL-W]|nr:hypothetical protein [Chloroflexi bacterium AL-N1]NOK64772.1 hypothetical protein [Chloroflexi bacterium AL-N10]NOK80228.1 hypothetical protein [Chloroflexi bacterium AL-W]NOK86741.1 hypothetical protein [Chloroflexi bacterium AL-N15]
MKELEQFLNIGATYLSTRYRVLKRLCRYSCIVLALATYLSTRYRVLKHGKLEALWHRVRCYISFDSLQSTETETGYISHSTAATYLSTRYRVLKPRRHGRVWCQAELHIFRLATEY